MNKNIQNQIFKVILTKPRPLFFALPSLPLLPKCWPRLDREGLAELAPRCRISTDKNKSSRWQSRVQRIKLHVVHCFENLEYLKTMCILLVLTAPKDRSCPYLSAQQARDGFLTRDGASAKSSRLDNDKSLSVTQQDRYGFVTRDGASAKSS